MNPARLFYAALAILSVQQSHAQPGYPWTKVDTVTSGPSDEFNPVLLSNNGIWQPAGPVRMIFERRTSNESQIVTRTFQTASAGWDTSEVVLSRTPADQVQKKPAYAAATYYGPAIRTVSLVAWQHWTGARWEILYSSLPAPGGTWSAPAPLVSDSVDNTDARVQIRDSVYLVTWKRGRAVMGLFKSPVGTTPPETLAVSNTDSSTYDLSSHPGAHATLIWTTRVDGMMTAVSRFVDWNTLEPAVPETLRTTTPCYNPRLLSIWVGDPLFLYESRVFSTWQVLFWQGAYFGGNISSDESADNLRGGAYASPIITKPGRLPKGMIYPFNICVYERIRPGDSALVFLPPWGQGDTLRTPGYNRNACIGSSMIWIQPDENVVVVWESNRSGRSHIYSRLIRIFVGAADDPRGSPSAFSLMQNFPNPFNPSTVIRYTLPAAGEVTLTVFNILGQTLATIVHESQEAGEHETRFDGKGLAGGVYFYRLQAGNLLQTRKMVMVR